FKHLVTPEQFERLKDIFYLDSKEAIVNYGHFIDSLGIKKIKDWWDHKALSEWIIPCLIESQSGISPESWRSTPATTNTGESQHHWTNSITGTNLSLVEAIEKARELDEDTARQVESSMKTGILANPQNEAYHRTARSLQRQSKTAQKVRDSDELTEFQKQTNSNITTVQEKRRLLLAEAKSLGGEEKSLRESLKSAKSASKVTGRASGTRPPSVIVSASSTGRVKTVAGAVTITTTLSIVNRS
ncbi:hypothetical protein C8R43DRAFT_904091, partial [Mycena crocata]